MASRLRMQLHPVQHIFFHGLAAAVRAVTAYAELLNRWAETYPVAVMFFGLSMTFIAAPAGGHELRTARAIITAAAPDPTQWPVLPATRALSRPEPLTRAQ